MLHPYYRRRVGRRRLGRNASTWTNLSGSGPSQSLKWGPFTINTRGRVYIRTPIKGLSLRGKL